MVLEIDLGLTKSKILRWIAAQLLFGRPHDYTRRAATPLLPLKLSKALGEPGDRVPNPGDSSHTPLELLRT